MSNRLASVSNGAVSAPVGYDAAGNFVSYQGATYEYDALNVMRKSVARRLQRGYEGICIRGQERKDRYVF
jgi:hypothetical protein